MIDERKRKLYFLLNKMVLEVVHRDYKGYLSLKNKYEKGFLSVFGKNYKKNQEAIYWKKPLDKLEQAFSYNQDEKEALKKEDTVLAKAKRGLAVKLLGDISKEISYLKKFFEVNKEEENISNLKKRMYEVLIRLIKLVEDDNIEEYEKVKLDYYNLFIKIVETSEIGSQSPNFSSE